MTVPCRTRHGQGLYPLYYIFMDGQSARPYPVILCPTCANAEEALGTEADADIAQQCANYEDDNLVCEGCNKRIPSAYGDND